MTYRTANLQSCILYISSINISTEYFKHGVYSPFFLLQNAVCFIILTSGTRTSDSEGVVTHIPILDTGGDELSTTAPSRIISTETTQRFQWKGSWLSPLGDVHAEQNEKSFRKTEGESSVQLIYIYIYIYTMFVRKVSGLTTVHEVDNTYGIWTLIIFKTVPFRSYTLRLTFLPLLETFFELLFRDVW